MATYKSCSIEGCHRQLVARGLCATHYQQAARQVANECSVDGCLKPVQARGWCGAHYAKFLRYGTPVYIRFYAPHELCEADDCYDPRPRNGSPYCKPHQVQMRRSGVEPQRRHVTKCVRCGHEIERRNVRTKALCEPCRQYGDAARRHGITGRRYWEMGCAQDWRCAFCRTDEPGGKGNFVIDHDHNHCPSTYGCAECVRWLLCNRCNRAVGGFDDDPVTLRRAADLLEQWELLSTPLDPAQPAYGNRNRNEGAPHGVRST